MRTYHVPKLSSLYGLFLAQLLCVVLSLSAQTPDWVTQQNALAKGEDPTRYTSPSELLVFVAANNHVTAVSCNSTQTLPPNCGSCVNSRCSGPGKQGHARFGTDVLSANVPTEDISLMSISPDGTVRRLFPVQGEHEALIDDQIGMGAVVEPNVLHHVVEDGRYVIFGYFHNATNAGAPKRGSPSWKGADLYIMDLEPLKNNPDVPISQIPVRRLTHKTYSNGKQIASERNANAMNPLAAGTSQFGGSWGNVYMHAVDMMTASGPKLVFVTNDVRLMDSNTTMALPQDGGHNFVLKTADLDTQNWSLKNMRQFQYYTTTSVLSPAILRNGIAASYKSTTQTAIHWQIQSLDSEGLWKPLVGYGASPALFHLGTLCQDATGGNPGDKFLSIQYYNLNNNGFGAIDLLPMESQGINELVAANLGSQPAQIWQQQGLTRITRGVTEQDDPSGKKFGRYIGKFSTPRCSGDNEVYSAYTPTSANNRLFDAEGNRSLYYAQIVKHGLQSFDPVDDSDPLQHKIIIKDQTNTYSALFPTPIVTFQHRLGQPQGTASEPIASAESEVLPGMPHATIGSSALYNTDMTAIDCRLGKEYRPSQVHNNFALNHGVKEAVSSLHFLSKGKPNWCDQPLPTDIFGIAVNLTSNKINLESVEHGRSGYASAGETASNQQALESVKLLGVYDVRSLDGLLIPGTASADQSFKAKIPANVPFEFHLIDRRYGLRAADVRSWHSLKPGEFRADCGGCHDHREGAGIPFEGSHADLESPQDFTDKTPYIKYDTLCQPVMAVSNEASLKIPVWHNYNNPGQDDLFGGFVNNCGGCHASGSGNPAFTFNTTDPVDGYSKIKNYILNHEGALGSPAFWAARGRRTDGRDNNYYLNLATPEYFHTAHPDLCDGSQTEAVTNWIYRFGLWMDNHSPRDIQGRSYPYHHDRYHPSVNSAFVDSETCNEDSLRVGFWDDSGEIAQLQVALNGQSILNLQDPAGIANGAVEVSIPAHNSDDLLQVKVTDAAGNTQKYEKSIFELHVECLDMPVSNGGGENNGTSTPEPSSSPSSSPTPESTPTPGPTPGSGNSSGALFEITPALTETGKILSFKVSNAPQSDYFKVLCSTKLADSGEGATVHQIQSSLSESKVFVRSLALPWSPLADGSGSRRLRIPAEILKYGNNFHCQALLSSGSGEMSFTATRSFSVTQGKTKKGMSAKKRRQLRSKFREISSALAKEMDRSISLSAQMNAVETTQPTELANLQKKYQESLVRLKLLMKKASKLSKNPKRYGEAMLGA